MNELDIIQRDMHDYADRIAERIKKHSGLEFNQDLIFYQIKDYLDRKSQQNILRSYALHWFNNYIITISLNMTQTIPNTNNGNCFSVNFPHLKADNINTAVQNYDRAMKGV